MAIEITQVDVSASGSICIQGNGGEEEAIITWTSRQDRKYSWLISSVSCDDEAKVLLKPTIGSKNKLMTSVGLTLKKWMKQGIEPSFDVEKEWLKLKIKIQETIL